MSAAGARLFARYAYPPNELGYCGPAGAREMLRAPADEIGRRARSFDGAWAYLEFLARAARLADPLAEEVVRAYWVGNSLVSVPDPADLRTFLRERFAGQAGGTWDSAGAGAVAHHSFHVFEVYPWAGLLRRTGNPTAVSVLDRCRIRTGVVQAVHGETATVSSRPLTWDGVRLRVGETRSERVAWSVDGSSLWTGPAPGDRVALHWDWICDRISEDEAARIEDFEERRLSLLASRT